MRPTAALFSSRPLRKQLPAGKMGPAVRRVPPLSATQKKHHVAERRRPKPGAPECLAMDRCGWKEQRAGNRQRRGKQTPPTALAEPAARLIRVKNTQPASVSFFRFRATSVRWE